MKLELPFAVGLLALGCLLCLGTEWFTGRTPILDNAPSADALPLNRLPGSSSMESGESPSGFAVQQATATEPLHHEDRGLPSPNSDPLGDAIATGLEVEPGPFVDPDRYDANSKLLLRQSAQNLLNSPPISARSRIRTRLFGELVTAEGRLLHLGQGTHCSRYEFFSGDSDTSMQVVQICNGRVSYLIKTHGGQSWLEFIDLNRIAGRTSPDTDFAGSPNTWMATGGLTGLLEHLAKSFEFNSPRKLEIGGIPMVSIRGQWRRGRLQQLLQGQINLGDNDTQIEWDQLPPQLPHAVEIILGNDEFAPLFPYRMIFHQYENDGQAKPLVSMEMYEVEKVERMDVSLFSVQQGEFASTVDATSRFENQLEFYQQMAKANRNDTRHANSNQPSTDNR